MILNRKLDIKVPSKRKILFFVPTILYLLFFLWYTNLSGPLTQEEIDTVLDRLQSQQASPAEIARMRQFMEEDTGRQFIMVNLIDMNPNPPELPATGPGASSGQLMGYYMEYMYPALLRRASHPVFAGLAIAPAMDIVGIEGAENWDRGALMRYRSRRDLLEIAGNPVFNDRHDYKVGALTKTIAYPVEVNLYFSDPRFLLLLILLVLTLTTDALVYRRS